MLDYAKDASQAFSFLPCSRSDASPNQLPNICEHLESIIDGHLKPLQSIRKKKKKAEDKLKTVQIENSLSRAMMSATSRPSLSKRQ